MIRLIAAIDSRRGIATDSGIPWSLAGDTNYFREQTKSGLIVMGRGTYDEFANPLHGKDNYVLTRAKDPFRDGFRSVESVDALRAAHPYEDIWVIGGALVYAETVRGADELLITQVSGDFHCTKFFPPYRDQFKLVSTGDDQHDGPISYRFETWGPAD